ncbi:MAG: aminotransferase class V-fold PLP-dependent enzyme [Eubacteriales bacterium]|nr:aminotransferase class V-fold PLP-dependent enzyme [Eubacteriales bacterium]MDD4744357.1 aminotransferase class V-fold PLP-dependent enzyme [Eubacteriales bacterium]
MPDMTRNPVSEPSKTIRTPIGPGGLGRAMIGEEEIQAVTDLLRQPEKLFRYRGSEPTQSSMLEHELETKLGVKHALFVNTGTSALTCCLVGLGIGPGDEVIVPAYTYIATATAVVNAGAVPVIAEIDESLGLSPADVKKKITPYTRAIIPVHMQGVPAKMAELRQVARENNLKVIEDACQAIGSQYQGVTTGVESDAFAWSLNFFKVITCGEGGVFFTNDDSAFLRGVYLSDPGSPMWDSGLKGDMHVPPFSKAGYRGNEINAAVARVQLRKMDGILSHTRALKKLLLESLAEPIHYCRQQVDDPQGECGISFAMIAESDAAAKAMSDRLLAEGLQMGTAYNDGFPDRHIYSYWDSILYKRGTTHLNYPWGDPSYKGQVSYSKDMCPQTLDILGRCLRLSIHLGMNEQNIREIAEAINKVDRTL